MNSFSLIFFSFSEQDDGHPFLRAATRRRRLEGRQTRLGICVFDGREEEEEEEVGDEGSRDLIKEQKQQWTRSEFFGEEREQTTREAYTTTQQPMGSLFYYFLVCRSCVLLCVCVCFAVGAAALLMSLLGGEDWACFQCRCARRLVLGGWLVFVRSEMPRGGVWGAVEKQ